MVATSRTGLNRKQRKELARRLRAQDPGLEIVHPHAAGIDIGNSCPPGHTDPRRNETEYSPGGVGTEVGLEMVPQARVTV